MGPFSSGRLRARTVMERQLWISEARVHAFGKGA